MWDRENMAALVAELVTAQVREFAGGYYQVPVGISARHIHLTREDVEALFGPGHRLPPMTPVSYTHLLPEIPPGHVPPDPHGGGDLQPGG